jgi:hypothetical protein
MDAMKKHNIPNTLQQGHHYELEKGMVSTMELLEPPGILIKFLPGMLGWRLEP